MSFKQYTSCIDAGNFTTLSVYWQASLAAAATGGVLSVIPILAEPWCLPFLIPIMAALWIMVYCQWFLHGRLICLPDFSSQGEDQTVIGLLMDTDPPGNKPFFDSIDTDYSLGLLPMPNLPGAGQQAVQQSLPYGFLTLNQPATSGLGLPFTGHRTADQVTEVLHCEFEGAGVWDLLLAARISFAIAVAALAVCLLIPGWIGIILAILLALLSLLGDYIGVRVGQNDVGLPTDENPAAGDIRPGVDILALTGSWVYDSGHNPGGGWNEIHPVKSCTIMGKWKGAWPVNVIELKNRWGVAFGDAASPATLQNQLLPQNQWQVHPVIDGCQPPVIIV
jgi:hypothetical protein